jgi:hypothetical protein
MVEKPYEEFLKSYFYGFKNIRIPAIDGKVQC